jgi:hypothetical protein
VTDEMRDWEENVEKRLLILGDILSERIALVMEHERDDVIL